MKIEQKCWKCFYKETYKNEGCHIFWNRTECVYPRNEDQSDASDNFMGQKDARRWKQIRMVIYVGNDKKPYTIAYVKTLLDAKHLAKLYLGVKTELKATNRYWEKYPITPEYVIEVLKAREYIKTMDYYTKEECVIGAK